MQSGKLKLLSQWVSRVDSECKYREWVTSGVSQQVEWAMLWDCRRAEGERGRRGRNCKMLE